MIGLEPTTFTLATGAHTVLSAEENGLTDGDAGACTNACTNSAERAQKSGAAPLTDNAAKARETTVEQPTAEMPVLLADAAQRDADLAAVIAAWPNLPDHIKATIRTLVDSAGVPSDASE